MKAWALAYLHITPRDFGELRPAELWEALRLHLEEKDGHRKYIGELIRGATLRLWNTQVGEKFRISDVAMFWQMPWDDTTGKESSVSSMSDDEIRQNAQDFIRFLDGTE